MIVTVVGMTTGVRGVTNVLHASMHSATNTLVTITDF